MSGITRDTVVLRVEKVGFRARRFLVTISPLEETDVPVGTVRLSPAARRLVTLKLAARAREGKRPLEGVVLTLNDRAVAYTGAEGSFTQPNVPVFAGLNAALARRLGYQAIGFDLWIPEGQTELALELVLEPAAITLGEVVVRGEQVRVRYPGMEAFERRARLGHGDFLTEARIRRIGGFDAVGLLRWLPGHSVWIFGGPSSGYHVQLFGSICRPPVFYVNGVRLEEGSAIDRLEMLAPEDVLGVEVYRHAGQIPPEFNATGSSCGVIAFWTRR